MITTSESIAFDYLEEDKKLFTDDQKEHWENIEKYYKELRSRCQSQVHLPQTGPHKTWIKARVNLHVTTSLMRLLYLVESFVAACKSFNAVAAATHVKAMVEIPMHLGYLVWILDSHSTFEDIRAELMKIAWGDKNKKTGLTGRSKISQETFYKRADGMVRKFFKEGPQINIMETIYREANATGHHNYEGRNVLVGVMPEDTWHPKDRKEWFAFLSNNIFQFFLHCGTILWMSNVFLKAIDHYLDQMPLNLPTKPKNFWHRVRDYCFHIVNRPTQA